MTKFTHHAHVMEPDDFSGANLLGIGKTHEESSAALDKTAKEWAKRGEASEKTVKKIAIHYNLTSKAHDYLKKHKEFPDAEDGILHINTKNKTISHKNEKLSESFVETIIAESINENPLGVKEALISELMSRISNVLEAKKKKMEDSTCMSEEELDEKHYAKVQK